MAPRAVQASQPHGDTCYTSVRRATPLPQQKENRALYEHSTTFQPACITERCRDKSPITTLPSLLRPILDGRKRHAATDSKLREHLKHRNLRVQVKQKTPLVFPLRQQKSTQFAHPLNEKGRSDCASACGRRQGPFSSNLCPPQGLFES